ncbi:MAG TPA: hypothetical protein VHF05_03265 [Candidatus Paceibacterota bacterium]|jgi:hypothetical protein|nr:hypothetical protein [Candidatus Paceibacterota bacterium]
MKHHSHSAHPSHHRRGNSGLMDALEKIFPILLACLGAIVILVLAMFIR